MPKEVITLNSGYFKYASPTLKADIDLVLPAVVLCGAYAALQHVSAELQVDTRLDFLRRRSTRLDYRVLRKLSCCPTT